MMEMSLPLKVVYIIYKMRESGFEAYIVGGAVRDTLMEKETKDWDFTTNANPEEIRKIFPNSFYNNEFGTIGVIAKDLGASESEEKMSDDDSPQNGHNEIFEITTYRHEYGYSDNRRPDRVEWGKTLKDDLMRRDFTINSLAIDVVNVEASLFSDLNSVDLEEMKTLKVEIIDYYDGVKDLENQVIRAVGDPNERFKEDALRMLRAIRFGAQLGFSIETETAVAINENAQLIEQISWERKRDEFLKILSSKYPADGVLFLYSSGLLEFLIPELLETIGVKQGGHHIYDVWKHSIESLRNCPSTDPIVRMATLLHDIGKPRTYQEQGPRGVTFYNHEVVGSKMVREIGKRFRLSNKQLKKLVTLVRWHMFVYEPEMTDAAIRRFIRRVGVENINDMMLLRVGDRKGSGSRATSWRLREMQQRIGEQLYEPLSIKDLKINGLDVMKTLNIKPGPKVGQILNQLFEEVLEDSEKNNRDYLLERLRLWGEA